MRACLLVMLALAAVAETASAAPAFVRASSRGDGIAVIRGARSGGGTLWLAPDGATFERHELPASRWLLDAHVTETGDVLLATTAVPRGGPIVLGLFVPGAAAPVERELAGSETLSDARFLDGETHLALVTSSRAFVSSDGGGTFVTLPEWEADVYAFYAASGRVTPGGSVQVLAPTFNTCTSADFLEELTMLSARPRARAAVSRPVHLLDADFPSAAALMADGGILTLAIRDGGACVLRARTAAGVRNLGGRDACRLLTATNRRFTVAVAGGGRVLRVTGLSSEVLGHLTQEAVDVTPDARGRALVLLGDGRVVRYAARAAPTVVLVAEP